MGRGQTKVQVAGRASGLLYGSETRLPTTRNPRRRLDQLLLELGEMLLDEGKDRDALVAGEERGRRSRVILTDQLDGAGIGFTQKGGGPVSFAVHGLRRTIGGQVLPEQLVWETSSLELALERARRLSMTIGGEGHEFPRWEFERHTRELAGEGQVELVAVESSNVEAIGYDLEHVELHVSFRSGDVYVYGGVERSIWEALLDAPSKGSFVKQRLQGRHRGRRYRR